MKPDGHIGRRAARACFGQGFIASSAVTFVWTAIPARMEWRYDLAAHKVIAIDAGHVCQNLYLACQALGAGCCAWRPMIRKLAIGCSAWTVTTNLPIYLAAVGKKSRQ